ncbi:MAG: hypothetical protein R3C02_02695 [Planctomycetaceae bacterium]
MTDTIRKSIGFSVGALIAMSCLFIGKVVAVDVPHSPLSVIASMIQEPLAPAKPNDSLALLANPASIEIASPVDVSVAELAPEAPVATPHSLYHVVMNDQSVMTGRLQVAQYGLDGVADDVVVAPNTSVKLISHCTTSYEGLTDQDGHFQLESVVPGVYTLLADGPLGVLVMRVSVESNSIFPTSELNALLVPNVDAHYVRSVINERLPQETTLPGYLDFDQVEVPEATVTSPLDTHVSVNTTPAHDYEMTGRLFRLNPASGEAVPVSETAAELIRNGRGVQAVSFEDDGECELDTLEAAHYSFVAVGVDGICAIGIEAGPCGELAPPIDPYAGGCCTEMAVVPYDECAPIIVEEIIEEPCYEEDYGCGFGQAGCCGGGGGGGGCGYGSLLGLAGLAGLAGLIDDGNDHPKIPPPPPASPFAHYLYY